MKRRRTYRPARERDAGQSGAEHGHAFETGTKKVIGHSETQVAENLSRNQPQRHR